MAKEAHIYQKEGLGWYIELAGNIEGPLESCEDAENYVQLIQLVCAARKDFACLNGECLV